MTRILLLVGLALFCSSGVLASQTIRGAVLDAESGGPVGGATVELLTEDSVVVTSTTADAAGEFALGAGEPGAYRLQARQAGYQQVTTAPLELESRDTLDVQLRLSTQLVVLQPLTIVGSTAPRTGLLAGFHQRAARGAFGTFITREQIERQRPIHASELLRMVPGVQVTPTWWGRSLITMRGRCIPRIYLDGMPVLTGSIDDLVSTLDLEGIEVYRSPAEAPAELAGPGSACGVVALWTRRGP